MVTVAYSSGFVKTVKKIQDQNLKDRIKTQIRKIVNNPETGKPMRYCRKNTREVYIPPFRLSYYFDASDDTVVFLTLYHKDKQ
ncbi:MAG: type II toxin-antitoxin system RelE/ParE family toxin [Methanomicrobiales archaeon]|nr:type II toxin-antitoxin system RelE/ParE family toxin [Methanomicrobiales archaeon]